MKALSVALILVLAPAARPAAGQAPMDRLPLEVLDVVPPSARVDGAPGRMSVRRTGCAAAPAASVARRIVDIAVQEWAFFGFTVVDHTEVEDDDGWPGPGRRRGLAPEAARRVAASIAGYWTATPSGAWILGQQNQAWNERGDATRWRYPWSAAFISWVMCESGLGGLETFSRAVAHHTYIDQAIRARDGHLPRAAFLAYDVGDAVIAPGDLLCSARRPAYRTLAERKRQMGVGARTHCDIVVQVDSGGSRILAIGGNVRGAVSLKVLPATAVNGRLRPVAPGEAGGARPLFAHLKRRGAPLAANSLDTSPTIQALGCGRPAVTPLARAAAPCALSLGD